MVATFTLADDNVVDRAITGALAARGAWEDMPLSDRCAIFLKAADLLASDKYRYKILAATILGQGKNAWQAEIDAACELIDFWRFNASYACEIYSMQPEMHAPATWNTLEYRALEGFVLAVSPFNFTAIGGNLCSAPAIMGNVVIWKPSMKAMLSNYIIYQILEEAGMPPGVIQFLPGDDAKLVLRAMESPHFAALHFTGSSHVFNLLWQKVANNIDKYRSYPRLIGETGGKNMHFVHPSADVDHVLNSTVRATFEYQGQKCSACSRLYVPESLWAKDIKPKLIAAVNKIKVGPSRDFDTFVGPVIDRVAFDRISNFVSGAKDAGAILLCGGNFDDSTGYFVSPTVLEIPANVLKPVTTSASSSGCPVTEHTHVALTSEAFGPVLSVVVYPDGEFNEYLAAAAATSKYALTCAFFARDRAAICHARRVLRDSAGNFYINDKCTGAVVGQQPFGGARASGTNDKAGSMFNLLRWVSMRTIKESFLPLDQFLYPSNKL